MRARSTWRPRPRVAVAELYATLVIVAMAVSMSYMIYSELNHQNNTEEATFINRTTVIGGSPEILYAQVNSSEATMLSYAQLDNLSSTGGTFALAADGRYTTSAKLCGSGLLTFFSAYSQSPSQLSITSDGSVWIDGYWRTSATVSGGWSEVMISGGSSCAVSIPGGSVSPLPLSASDKTTHFTLFIPISSGSHTLLLVFTGGDDRIAFSA